MLTTTLTELPDHAALVSRSGGHPVARWHHSPTAFERAWSLGRAVGWTAQGLHGHVLIAVGDAAEAGRLVTAVLDGDSPAGRIAVPVAALPHVGRRLDDGWDWFWFWAERPPAERPREAAVARLDVGEEAVAADVTDLLRASSPRTSALPGDAGVDAWYGIRDDEGVLVACAGRGETAPGVCHLRAIATHPERRGQGLGADVTAAVMRSGFADGAQAVTLGMYADNDPARRLYERLGLRVGQHFATRVVPGPRSR